MLRLKCFVLLISPWCIVLFPLGSNLSIFSHHRDDITQRSSVNTNFCAISRILSAEQTTQRAKIIFYLLSGNLRCRIMRRTSFRVRFNDVIGWEIKSGPTTRIKLICIWKDRVQIRASQHAHETSQFFRVIRLFWQKNNSR